MHFPTKEIASRGHDCPVKRNVANVIRLPASVTNASVRMNPDMSHLPDNILYLPEDQVLDAKEMEGGLHFQIVSP